MSYEALTITRPVWSSALNRSPKPKTGSLSRRRNSQVAMAGAERGDLGDALRQPAHPDVGPAERGPVPQERRELEPVGPALRCW